MHPVSIRKVGAKITTLHMEFPLETCSELSPRTHESVDSCQALCSHPH